MSSARLKHRRFPTIRTSARDLAMLRVAPIDAASLPRVHVGLGQAAGALRVLDRSSGEEVLVYTPTFNAQFKAGHRAGRWYVRPALGVGGAPRSIAFATAREAVEAVAVDAWRLRVVSPDAPSHAGARPRLRVIWSTPDSTN
ncbi:hypothetical protein [Paludisphaera soli]|uniref:hypothetical protein n=1 Tax=Paludisphaera soli TaxID=2712865 RepID=UPI0013EC9910|nr:hypothetical protein [Paludisphaera soli]